MLSFLRGETSDLVARRGILGYLFLRTLLGAVFVSSTISMSSELEGGSFPWHYSRSQSRPEAESFPLRCPKLFPLLLHSSSSRVGRCFLPHLRILSLLLAILLFHLEKVDLFLHFVASLFQVFRLVPLGSVLGSEDSPRFPRYLQGLCYGVRRHPEAEKVRIHSRR